MKPPKRYRRYAAKFARAGWTVTYAHTGYLWETECRGPEGRRMVAWDHKPGLQLPGMWYALRLFWPAQRATR